MCAFTPLYGRGRPVYRLYIIDYRPNTNLSRYIFKSLLLYFSTGAIWTRPGFVVVALLSLKVQKKSKISGYCSTFKWIISVGTAIQRPVIQLPVCCAYTLASLLIRSMWPPRQFIVVTAASVCVLSFAHHTPVVVTNHHQSVNCVTIHSSRTCLVEENVSLI